MRGLVALDDVMAAFTPERREEIEARGAELLARVEKRLGVSARALGRVKDQLLTDGFCLVEAVLNTAKVVKLKHVISHQLAAQSARGGIRNLLDCAEMRNLASSAPIRAIVDSVLGPNAIAVRGTLFDKTSDANWKVPWHQDVTIAVAERVDAEGYGPWSNKAGVPHVQPPASVLEQMISVRIHLDDCPQENGALKVIAGSQKLGKIPEARVAEVVAQGRCEVCEVAAGGVLVMRPLLLHSSSAAVRPGHRRVIHFDFAVVELAAGMRWAAERATVPPDASCDGPG